MGRMQSTSKLTRSKQIIKFCEEPHTIKEMMEEFGIVYNTCWRYVDKLIGEGLLKPTDRLRDGSVLIVAGTISEVPEVYNSFLNQYWPLKMFLEQVIVDPNATSESERIAHDITHLVTALMYACQTENIEALAHLRAVIGQAYSIMESTAGILKQLFENDKLYEINSIKRMLRSEEWDSALVANANEVSLTTNHNIPDCYNPPVGASDRDATKLIKSEETT